MLKLSKKVEYALISLIHMDSTGRSGLVTARELSERYNIPGEILGKVLQALTRVKLVESTQGAKGGYRISRPLEQVTLGQVIEAVELPVYLVTCQDDPDSCSQYCACNIRDPVLRIQAQLTRFIHQISLSALRHGEHSSRFPVPEPVPSESAAE
jgi:Rrf2 family protein